MCDVFKADIPTFTCHNTYVCVFFSFTAYLGCFKENRRRPVFNRNPGAIQKGTLTPNKCISTCGAFQFSFAGLRAGKNAAATDA